MRAELGGASTFSWPLPGTQRTGWHRHDNANTNISGCAAMWVRGRRNSRPITRIPNEDTSVFWLSGLRHVLVCANGSVRARRGNASVKGPGCVMKNSTSFQTNTLETIKTQKQGDRRTERKRRKTDSWARRKNKHLALLRTTKARCQTWYQRPCAYTHASGAEFAIN